MGTSSTISLVEKDGTVKGIYCHWDGYPEGVGAVLKEHYTDINKIRELIDLGDIRSLYENISPSQGEHHNFDAPALNTTIAYHRDRGEPFSQYKEQSVGIHMRRNGKEYNYFYDLRRAKPRWTNVESDD